jgi:hypothetical protein
MPARQRRRDLGLGKTLGALALAGALLVSCSPPIRLSGFAPPTNVISFTHPKLAQYPLQRIAVFHFDNRTPSPDAGKTIAELFYEALKVRANRIVLPPMPIDYEQLDLEVPLGQRVGGRLPPPVVSSAAINRVLKQVEPAIREALAAGSLEPKQEPASSLAFESSQSVGIPSQIRLTEGEKAALDDAAYQKQRERLVDAIVVGVIGRYRNRQGHALTVVEPASVAYNIYLLSTLDGATLWQATFDETQVPLFENIMLIDRFVEGKGVWQTHDTLARIGISRVLADFPGVILPAPTPPEPTIETE